MKRLKVRLMYFGFFLLFAVVFIIMWALLIICAAGIPCGILMSIFGAAVLLFDADFIITALNPTFMIFGGLSLAFTGAFCGFTAVKAGFIISRLFIRIKRHCDILRGW